MRLVKELETHGSESGGIEEIISLMDSYFLTKDDWDAIYELGLGPCAAENVTLSTQNKTQFTRKYNAMRHPLPFMKASGTVGPTKKGKDKPDLEEAIEESDEEELLAEAEAVSDGEEELDLKKDKYVQQPKKRKAPAASKKSSKKAKVEDEDKADDAEVAVSSEEDVKPRKGKGKAKAGAAKGRAKK
jgi:replication factor C subunit 1